MSTFKLSKVYEGKAALDLISNIKPRPDLDNAVLIGTYYEIEGGKIINALLIRKYKFELGLPPESFPRFCVFNIYDSESKFWDRVNCAVQSILKEGIIPPPVRNYKESIMLLSGQNAAKFLQEHEDLGVGKYWFGKATDSIHYFKDKEGRVISAKMWLKEAPLYIAEFRETTGPWITTHLIYESEAHAKGWQDYILGMRDETKNHLLYPYTHNKPNWPKELPNWLAFLAGKLKIPVEQLDFSLASCELLESQRKKLRVSYKRYLKDFFAPCLGYIYEVVRRSKNGTWEMRPAPAAPTVFEPFINLEGGRRMHFFVEYWDWVYENYEEFTISGMAQMAAEDF